MPTPREGETKSEFIARCMSDEKAIADFPDTQQRVAFCNSEYESFVNQRMNKSDIKKEFTKEFLEAFYQISKESLDEQVFKNLIQRAIPKAGGRAKANRTLVRKIHDTISSLSEQGRIYVQQNFDAETIRQWIEPTFATVELQEKELEELALSMGHHRNIMIGEAMGSAEAGFRSRSGGLMFSIDQTTKLIERIKEANEFDLPLKLSQWDFVNLLGSNSYERIIVDHSEWMNSLPDEKIDMAQLLENFKTDFQELTDIHDQMQENLRQAELFFRTEEVEMVEGNNDGVMVGFFLPEFIGRNLVIENGEKAEQLHLTLSFHGNKSDLSKNAKNRMLKVLNRLAKRFSKIKGEVNGFGRFNGSKNSGHKDVLYATFDSPLLPEFRQELVNELEKEGIETKKDHGFIPHITLAYGNKNELKNPSTIKNQKINFSHITLAFGNERHHVRLEGSGNMRKQELNESATNAVRGALNILQEFEEEIPENILMMLENLLRNSNVEQQIKRIDKQELTEDAENAVIAAIRILQAQDDIPAEVLEAMTDLLSQEAFEELIGSAKKQYQDDEEKRRLRKDIFCEFVAKENEQRLVYGVVLEPNMVDAHGDFIGLGAIEEAAHEFMLKSQVLGKGHKNVAKAKIVESFVAPSPFVLQGQLIKKGSWVLVTKVMDKELWLQIKNGEFTGYSVGGFGHLVERDTVS